MEYFSRYFVRDAEGNTEEIYDGDDDRDLALSVAASIGGYVDRLDYVSDGQ